MEASLPEILMLLGDQMVKVHERDKQIRVLEAKIDELSFKIIELKAELDGVDKND